MTVALALRRFLTKSRILSAKGLFARAVGLSLVFLVCHLAGLRAYTSILCGTYPSAGWASSFQAFFGLLYVLVYLVFTGLVPVLLIAAALLYAWERVGGRGKPLLFETH